MPQSEKHAIHQKYTAQTLWGDEVTIYFQNLGGQCMVTGTIDWCTAGLATYCNKYCRMHRLSTMNLIWYPFVHSYAAYATKIIEHKQ